MSVGIIGCGSFSHLAHIPNLASSSRAEVIAISDPRDARRASALPYFPSASAYSDAQDVISNPDLEAVVIAVPPSAAADLAIAAFEAGKHVLLEKPGAVTVAEAKAICSAWMRSGKMGAIGYNFRRHRAVSDAKRRILAGQIGEIISIMGLFTWSGGGVGGWRADPKSGGALLDLASHHVDLARWLVGRECETAQTDTRSVQNPQDTADVLLGFAGGANAMLHVSSAGGRNANRIYVLGQTGHIEVDLTQPEACRVYRGEPPRSRLARLKHKLAGFDPRALLASGKEPSFALLLEDFLQACATGSPITPDFDDALAVLSALEMGRDASRHARRSRANG